MTAKKAARKVAKKAAARRAPAKKAAPRCVGRPTAFNPEIADRICVKVAEGLGIERVGKLDGFPAAGTIYRWLAKEGEQFDVFRENYARATEIRADARFEKLREIAEQTAEGSLDPQAARAAADIEKWCLAREKPRKYGDAMTVRGDKDNPLQVRQSLDLSETELLAIAAGSRAD